MEHFICPAWLWNTSTGELEQGGGCATITLILRTHWPVRLSNLLMSHCT